MQYAITFEKILFSYVFNLYDMLVLVTLVLAVLLIIPLLLKKDRRASDAWLSAFLLSQGAISLNIVLLFNESIGPVTYAWFHPYHFLPITTLYALQGYFLYWFSKSMMGETIKFKDKTIGIGAFLLVILVFESGLLRSNLGYAKHYFWGELFILFSVGLGIYSLFRLRIYDNSILQNFSNIDRLRLQWLWHCCLGFVLVWSLVLLCYMLGELGYYELSKMIGKFSNLPPMLLMSIMVIYSQTLNRPSDTLDHPGMMKTESEEFENKANPQPINQNHVDKLEDLMERVKIYQDPDLRLEGLADSMGISSRSVSTILNTHYQKNFYDFVNQYRVMDAKKQLLDPDNATTTIQRIFLDAGFNSKTTFNTLFKKVTGKTPSQFRKLEEMELH